MLSLQIAGRTELLPPLTTNRIITPFKGNHYLQKVFTPENTHKLTDCLIWGFPCIVPLVQQRQYINTYVLYKDLADCICGSLVFLLTRGGVHKLVTKLPMLKKHLPEPLFNALGTLAGAFATFSFDCFVPIKVGKFMDAFVQKRHGNALASQSSLAEIPVMPLSASTSPPSFGAAPVAENAPSGETTPFVPQKIPTLSTTGTVRHVANA
jgi:hypothetical protein